MFNTLSPSLLSSRLPVSPSAEERDLRGNATYVSSKSTCMDCKEDKCANGTRIRPSSSSARGSIHSIPHVTVYLIGCFVAMTLARTLCGQVIS